LKLLLLTNKIPYPANDGSSIAMASMVEAYRLNQVELSLLSLNTRKHFRSPELIKASVPKGLRLEVIPANTDITLTRTLSNLLNGSPFHVSRFYIKKYAQRLEVLLQTEQFDVVQLDGLSMGVYLPIIRNYSKAKVVYRAHNLEYEIWNRHAATLANPLKKKYLKLQVNRLKRFERRILLESDAVLAITDQDKQKFKNEVQGQQYHTTPCGVSLKEKPLPAKAGKKFDLVYLASFDWEPNVAGALWFIEEVWPLILKQRPGTTFHLGGRNIPPQLMKHKGGNLEITENVASMRDFISEGRLVIIPLLAGSGMRIKILENMALGCCQLSTTIGAEGIKLQDGKDIHLADDPKDFAAKAIELINDKETRKATGKNARKTAEEFYSNRAIGQETVQFLEEKLC